MTAASDQDDYLAAREMLARLVAFPTVSSASNLDIVHFIRDHLAAHGVAAHIVPSPDGQKANIWATIGPDTPGGLVLSGHTDVVPVEGHAWSSDPWTLTERGGRLYGRGACDMKGFNATVLAAVPLMVRAGLKRPVHIAMSYDEEIGCVAAGSMIDAMAATIAPPEAVFVGEPSRLKVVTGHKGSINFWVEVTGHAVHSSLLDRGVSAVMTAGRLVAWFDDIFRRNQAAADPTSLFDPPFTTAHVGIIRGGSAANIVADSCGFSGEFRAVPGENPRDYLARFESFVRTEIEPAMKAIAPETGVTIVSEAEVIGLKPEENGAAERLARQLTGDNSVNVVSFGTEAGLFQRKGWSTVICGPGDIAQAHQPDEYIEASQLAAGARFIRAAVARLAE